MSFFLSNYSFPPKNTDSPTNIQGLEFHNNNTNNAQYNNNMNHNNVPSNFNFDRRRESVVSFASNSTLESNLTNATAPASFNTSAFSIPEDIQNKCRELQVMICQVFVWKTVADNHSKAMELNTILQNNRKQTNSNIGISTTQINKLNNLSFNLRETDSPGSMLTSENLALFRESFPTSVPQQDTFASQSAEASRMNARRESNASVLSLHTDEILASQPHSQFTNLFGFQGLVGLAQNNSNNAQRMALHEMQDLFCGCKLDFFEMKTIMQRISDVNDYGYDTNPNSKPGSSIKSTVQMLSQIILKQNISDFFRHFNQFIFVVHKINAGLPCLDATNTASTSMNNINNNHNNNSNNNNNNTNSVNTPTSNCMTNSSHTAPTFPTADSGSNLSNHNVNSTANINNANINNHNNLSAQGVNSVSDDFSTTYTKKRKRKNEKPKDYDSLTWNFTLKKSNKKK